MDSNLQRNYSTESSDTDNEYVSAGGSEESDKDDSENDIFYDATDSNDQSACDYGIHDHGQHSTGTENSQQSKMSQETVLVPSNETGSYIRVLRKLEPVEVNVPDTLKKSEFFYKDDDWISVTFHALIAPEVKFNCKTDKIYMYMWSTLNSIDTFLAVVEPLFVCYRKDAYGAAEFIGSALFKRMSTYGVVSYLYYIDKKGTSSKGKPRTSFYEEIYTKSFRNKRQLHFKFNIKTYTKESSDQYDGFVYKPNKQHKTSFWSWGSTPSKRTTDETESIIKVYWEDIVEFLSYQGLCSKSIAKFVERIKCLVLCVERSYGIESTQVSQAIKALLENKLLSYLHCEEKLHVEMKFTLACAILKLHTSGTIKLLPDEYAVELLCKSFIPTIDKKQNVSIEWEMLCTENNKDTRNDLQMQLGTLAKENCIVERKRKSPLWMYLVPLLHLLDGMCQPFQQLPLNVKHNARIPKWWGQSDLLREVSNSFEKCRGYAWVKPLTEVIDAMRCLPKLDFYLPRTIMASLCFEELKDATDTHFFPPDVCCAAFYFHLKKQSKRDDPQLAKCLDSLLYQITSTDNVMEKNQIIASIMISIDMLQEALQKKHEGIVTTSVKIMLWLIAAKDTCDEENQILQEEENDSLFDLSKISNDICRWINNNKSKRQQFIEYLQVWNTFFEGNLQATHTITRWKELMKESFQSQIKNEIQEHKKTFANILVHTYCTGLEGFCEIIRDVLTPFVCNVLADVKRLKQSNMPKSEYQNLCKAVSVEFVRECEYITQKQGQFDLTSILSWSALPVFLEMLYANTNPAAVDEACKDNICRIGDILKVFNELLMKGTITVEELILINKNKGMFMSLNEILHRNQNTGNILETRYWEMTKYFENLSALRTLKSLCQQLEGVTVETKAIDEILEIDIDCSSLCDLVVIAPEHETNRVFVVRSKSLPSSVVDVLLHIEKLSNSVCLQNQWKEEACKLMPGSTLSLDELICCIHEPVRKRLQEFEEEFKKGSLTYKDIFSFVGRFYEDNYDDMISELSQICFSTKENIIQKRIKQFRQCKEVIAKSEIATEIIDIQTIYKLTGNFQPIETISHVDIQNSPLSSDRGDIIAASKSLDRFTKKELYCLQIFAKCYELVKWLRESMTHDGLRELKVFVDLAMMSAGDDIEKVSRVQSLHAGVTGYSSLIFDLQTESDYTRFLQKCEPVFHELQNTPLLPDKLEHAHRFLYWFKDIAQAHGAVEVTSFVQAEVINERGIYKIGTRILKTPQDTKQSAIHSSIADLTDIEQVLKLTVLVDERHEVPKEYTYEKLQDLQSRLMLVAGEEESSKKNVERFSLVLDGVVRLCNVYMKLVKSGCMLFQDFAIKLYCDTNPDRPVCAILEFENENIQLKCRKTSDEQLEDVMHKIASEMDNYLTIWLDYVDKNRKKYPELNHFTIEQLVILKREIAKLNDNKEPTHLIYPILHIVQNDCKPEDVVKAHRRATHEQETQLEKNEKDEVRKEETIENVSDENAFIQALIGAGYERLIPFALKQFPTFDISEALCWCIANEENVEKLESSQAQVKIEEKEEGSFTEEPVALDTLILRAIDDKSQFDRCEAMLLKLKEIWNDFLKSVVTNMKGFISLNHLGRFLGHLSRNDSSTIVRSLPPGFSDCTPNLIVCTKDAILYQTLSLYLTNDDQPLPHADEILTCSINTTFEQVDIFLRRAFFNAGGKLHCLMNADLMNLTICEEVEQRIQQFLRVSDKKYKYHLVIICDSANENKSTIISSLDKYRKTANILDEKTLRNILSSKFKMSEHHEGAAVVDFENSSVRVVKSIKSGTGKSLYKRRCDEKLQKLTQSTNSRCVLLPLHEKNINLSYVTGNLLMYVEKPHRREERIIHIDITNEVRFGIDYCLFNLLILGALVDKSGYVWRKLSTDLYLIEIMSVCTRDDCQILNILPNVVCRTPTECLAIYQGHKPEGFRDSDQLFDEQEYKSDMFQKPYACLKTVDGSLAVQDSAHHCIETLIKHCGVSNPSWSEIHHFVKFLYRQLLDFENNVFFSDAAQEILPGFALFVQRFLIAMSRDFSSRSLNITEESDELRLDNDLDTLDKYKMKRTWESSPHPYLFFNEDGQTFTFLGFYINNNFDLVDVNTNKVLERSIMSRTLRDALIANKVPIKENFDKLERKQKIERLCKVMGVELHNDTIYDKSYELTTDNCKKMMAVYMRFRCDIPVIVMGETGCGKTRLVKFLCELMVPRDKETFKPLTQNMVIMKVHGGIANKDIIAKVKEAEKKAIENIKADENMYTVLFFDEANTTESIGLIKEIMCDHSMEGKPLNLCKNLKFVAACNPYRKHPDDLIKKLNKAGLGYHVCTSKTEDLFGKVPMRHLVYRVQPLPHSLMAFVWDFGQLDSSTENLYIRQMVKRYMTEGDMSTSMVGVRLRNDDALLRAISGILSASQEHMRSLKGECSFVSLRDVERTLQVMCWFFDRSNGKRTMFELAKKKMTDRRKKDASRISDETRSLILALGVCYHASLTNRAAYRNHISKYFCEPCQLYGGPNQFLEEIDCFEEVFLDSLELEDNIARNQALKENVFMMVVCIELRIPLFLVGKPGSSKSLAKIIVTDAMQGRAAKHPLYKEFKQVQMTSFQCSPHSTATGIVSAFRQCASFQENYQNNLDKFVSVVVLDEIGLAEDSPKMPLKTLHPLLEDGCQGDETPKEYMKVAFMGLSNWSLDPAKMNRGLFVQREVPDEKELETTAKGICSSSKYIDDSLITPLAKAYLNVFNKASQEKREFFGLRDFYSFMKMINTFVKTAKAYHRPTYHKLRFAVLRNFSGIENLDTFSIFLKEVKYIEKVDQRRKPGDPDDSFPGLIRSWLSDEIESRHLLLLTENYSALPMFEQEFLFEKSVKPIIIFGSSFRRDQEYTQVCRNINKIKLCMETGKLVILVNSDNLYESLYDALNQYYVYFGGERYVDLGLGTHRVKCPVHLKFRLIVVAEKETVYKKFPIPLINRLEKHCLSSSTLLTEGQRYLADRLKAWMKEIAAESLSLSCNQVTDNDLKKIFIGYHEDACSAVAHYIMKCEETFEDEELFDKALSESKDIMLWCATPDAIVRLKSSKKEIQDIYLNNQAHDSVTDYLEFQFKQKERRPLYAQITTHSTLLTISHKQALGNVTGIDPKNILLLEALSSFDTEQQFNSKIKDHVRHCGKQSSLIVIQCHSGDHYVNLIACAKYSVLDGSSKYDHVNLLMIVQLTPMETKSFQSLQCGEWHSAHIDSLYSSLLDMPRLLSMEGTPLSKLLLNALGNTDDIDTVMAHEEILPDRLKKGREIGLDIKEVIYRCVQSAMSLIRDSEEDVNRATKRISWVFSILNDTIEKDSSLFVNGIIMFVKDIQAIHESESDTEDDWLAREAATFTSIQKYGTIRRACLKSIENKMIPILSAIFAELDTNRNLSILEYDSCSWQKQLWLSLLNTHEVGKYMKTIKCVNTQNSVNGRGFGGRTFQTQMPFSWIIIQNFEDLVKQERLTFCTNEEEGMKSVIGLLEGFDLKASLESVGKEVFFEALESYISDFTAMTYSEEKDRNLVAMYLKHKALSMATEMTDTSLTNTVLCVHRTFEEYAQSLTYFRDISSVWDGCNETLLRQKVDDLLENHDLALLALRFLIESLIPESKKKLEDTFDNHSGREKWLVKVIRYRQVVNQTITFYQSTGEKLDQLEKSKNQWNRIVVMQLFIENVCMKGEEQTSNFRCRPLWAQLLTVVEVNFKQMGALQKIEKFLQMCLSTMKSESEKKTEKCKKCGGTHTDKSRVLACTHEICEQCLDEILSENIKEQKCPICKINLEADWHTKNVDKEIVDRWIEDKVGDYRKRCNFFFMEVVSQLCFAGNTAPDPKVVDWLISCTFQQKTEFKVDIGLDQSKVFKSYIFKHLVRTDEKELRVHLEKVIEIPDADIGSQEQCKDIILTVIHSLEDKMSESLSVRGADGITIAKTFINHAIDSLEIHKSAVDQVFAIAKARVGLYVAGKSIHTMLFKRKSVSDNSVKQIEELLQQAKDLCEDREYPWKYLLLNISREFGVDVLLAACKCENVNINWIKKTLEDKVQDTVDNYTACGEKYLEMKQFVFTTFMSIDVQDYSNELNEIPKTITSVIMFELVLHREVNLSKSLSGKEKSEQDISQLKKIFVELGSKQAHHQDIPIAFDQDLIRELNLDANVDHGDRKINIKCVMFHWFCVIKYCGTTCNTFLKQFFQLALDPVQAKDYFLPCMPHDMLAGFKASLKTMYDGEKTVYFQCEKGHPYEIGDCGRPVQGVAKCFCGSPIGGTDYNVLHEKNRKLDDKDRTLPGHCLGPPQSRERGAIPERNLSPIQCALLKFLLHLTLCLGCGKNGQGIRALIKPDIKEKDVFKYLWDHILMDIEDLQEALTLNADEVLLFSHCVIDHIMDTCLNEKALADDNIQSTLSTQKGRDEWEEYFVDKFFKTILETESRRRLLLRAYEGLQKSSSLVKMLNECSNMFSGDRQPMDAQNISRNQSVWMHRSPVSLTRLKQALQRPISENTNEKQRFSMLEIFLNKQSELQAVRFLPSILQIHKALLRRYSRKLYKSEAMAITVAQLKADKIAGDDTDVLFEELIEAWCLIRKSLNNSLIRTEKGPKFLNEEMSTNVSKMDITDATSLIYLLPTTEGKGIFTYALVDYLVECHNDVIEQYRCSERGKKDAGFTVVQPKYITSAHVINFQAQSDLLPIVIANCSVGRTNSVHEMYDFEKIEKNVIERFISTKSKVYKKDNLQIELMTYRSNLTPASKLVNLEQKIAQEPFEMTVKTTICNEIKDVPVISQILSKLDIAINFLDITGGKSDEFLHEFMTDRLKMSKNVLTTKMQQACSLKHVKALWLSLLLRRCNIMVEQNKTTELIFEHIEPAYHAPVPNDVKVVYNRYLQHLSKERLFHIIDAVFEFITTVLSETDNREDEDFVDKGHFSLDECVKVFTEDIDIPGGILCIHALHFWVDASKIYGIRLQERVTAV